MEIEIGEKLADLVVEIFRRSRIRNSDYSGHRLNATIETRDNVWHKGEKRCPIFVKRYLRHGYRKGDLRVEKYVVYHRIISRNDVFAIQGCRKSVPNYPFSLVVVNDNIFREKIRDLHREESLEEKIFGVADIEKKDGRDIEAHAKFSLEGPTGSSFPALR
ncbi:hypothetical protein V1477_000278 [Vespula maculifrons]|uniref:Uncharacterized protein n=1 Tax=Vespula maculifrons TaxID=7453 RepID=A0ABD2D2P5_VESMC